MDTFPSINPTYQSPKDSLKRTLVANIDGTQFKQRTADGVNTEVPSWNLDWVVDTTGALTIESFLEGKEGYIAFKWIPLDEVTTQEFICETWNKTIISPGWFKITATFERFYTHDN